MKLKLVDDGPILARRYPVERRFNPDVPGAEWPFAETAKAPGDVVISLAVTPTQSAETTSRLRSWVARLAPKSTQKVSRQ